MYDTVGSVVVRGQYPLDHFLEAVEEEKNGNKKKVEKIKVQKSITPNDPTDVHAAGAADTAVAVASKKG